MAQLLGSRFCIESLRSDVTDLQGVLVDVWSRTGPARHASWKYPDRIAADLDLTDLLNTYDYSDEAEQCQVSHVVLIELVIDRLMLLLQSMTRYLEVSSSPTKTRQPHTAKTISHTSVGLVAKQYWGRLLTLQTMVNQLHAENTSMKQRICNLVNDVGVKTHQEVDDVCQMNQKELKRGGGDQDLVSVTPYSISCDASNRSTQTYETAFVPCESCAAVQESFHSTGHAVSHMCAALSLPSSVNRYISAAPSWMSASDVDRWDSAQTSDLEALENYLVKLTGTVEPLQKTVASAQEVNTALKHELTEEKSIRRDERRQFEGALQRGRDELLTAEAAAQRDAAQAENCQLKLEAQLEQVRSQLQEQEQMSKQLSNAKKELERELNEEYTSNCKVDDLYSRITSLKEELSEVTDKLEMSEKEAQKEKAKNKSLTRHAESLQLKQTSLTQRVDELDVENEKLRETRAELEQNRDTLEDSLYEAEQQQDQLESELREQQRLGQLITEEKKTLELSMSDVRIEIQSLETQLKEAKDHEKLLVAYPDLNGPVNSDLTGTGDLAQDMQNQVSANNIRIQLLEEQNAKLRNSVSKMLLTQSRQKSRQPRSYQEYSHQHSMPNPVPLWQSDLLANENGPNLLHDIDNSTGDHHISPLLSSTMMTSPGPVSKPSSQTSTGSHLVATTGSFLVGKAIVSGRRVDSAGPPRLVSGKKKLNGTKSESASVSSVRAYQQMKRNNWQKTNQSPSIVSPPGDKITQNAANVTVTCANCDKMFKRASDLDVHKHYCVGHI